MADPSSQAGPRRGPDDLDCGTGHSKGDNAYGAVATPSSEWMTGALAKSRKVRGT